MAEATGATTTPEISHAELLTARKADIKESDYSRSAELQKSMQRGRELIGLHDNNELVGTEGLEALRPREAPKFTRNTFDSMTREFGAGYAIVDEKGNIVIDKDKLTTEIDDPLLQTEIRRHQVEAEKSLSGIRRINTYAETLQEAERTGKTIEEIAKKNGVHNWETFRGTVLDTLLETNTIRSICPELDNITDPKLRRDFIDQYMARDPKFREAVINRLEGVRQGMDFAKVEQKAEYKQAQANKEAADKILKDAPDDIVEMFNTSGVEEFHLTPDEITNLKSALEGKADISLILAGIRQARMTEQLQNVAKYRELDQLREALEKRASRKDVPKTTTDDALTQLQEVRGKLDRVGEFSNLDQAQYDKLLSLTNVSVGNQSTAIGFRASQAIEALTQQRKAQETLTRLQDEVKNDMRKDVNDRLMDEAGKLTSLEGVLDNAMIDVLRDRYNDLIDLERQKIAKEQDETMKADLQTLQDVREKKMGLDIIVNKKGALERSGNVSYDQLAGDIRFAAFKGEEGIKRMILRDLVGTSFTREWMEGTMKRIGTKSWAEVDLASLTDDQKRRVEEVYAREGVNYLKNITMDYLKARAEASSTDRKILNINKVEWQLFDRNFPGMAVEAKEASEVTDDTLNTLVEKGVIDQEQRNWLSEHKGMFAGLGLGLAGILFFLFTHGMGSALMSLPHTAVSNMRSIPSPRPPGS